ncbi:hypothetical protein JMJ35_003047 [Cladonia borealis]|uniref:Uncharacterized protein n=1 Tax=Cladonia borealis TaxID=184061 RepID=A0AA39R610_9LECA|nr:hypothetical protein JMJ35_003047 [Cladonia borealis]
MNSSNPYQLPETTYTYNVWPNSSPSFSMQDALSTYSCTNTTYTPPLDNATTIDLDIFQSGCYIDGIFNCTAACQDVNQIFADISTFRNCMAIVSMQELVNRNISWELIEWSPTTSTNSDPSVSGSIDLHEPSLQDLASGVNRTILQCLQQYQDKYPGNDVVEMCEPGNTKPANLVQFPNVCDNVTSVPLNADVGGIGVYVSYWMQSGISLSAFLALKLCDKVPHQTKLHKFLPALKSATVEFHKAQSFFMLAIDIATQIVVRTGALNDGSVNLQGLYNNYVLIRSISLGGILPVSFMLLTLHSVGVRSWFLLTLSSFTVVLSMATLFTTGSFKPSQAELMKLRNEFSGSFPACGSKDPSNYCLQTNHITITSMDIRSGSVGGPILVFTFIILALIFLDYFGLKILSGAPPHPTNPQAQPSSSLRFGKAPLDASHCLYFIIWSCYFVFWAYYLRSLKLGASAGIVEIWAFGQIVAITIWAQPLFEYVKLLVQGLERGLQYRVSQPYSIVKTPDPSTTAP